MLSIKNFSLERATAILLERLQLDVAAGEIVTVMGVSGSGKSTLLNWMIGDLDPAFRASGELWLNDSRRDTLETQERRIGILFQDDLLFPHLSAGQNLGFALPGRFVNRHERRQRVEQTLDEIGMAGFHDRDPATLSGGQRARVSLMRTLLSEPEALLLDEPFSKLDATLRKQFRSFVFEQIERQRIPTLLVTHDPADVPQDGRVLEISHWQPQHV